MPSKEEIRIANAFKKINGLKPLVLEMRKSDPEKVKVIRKALKVVFEGETKSMRMKIKAMMKAASSPTGHLTFISYAAPPKETTKEKSG